MTEPRPTPVASREISPFCRHLHSKKLAFRASPPQTEEDVLDASRHCWCRLTQQALGPDGEIVAVRHCRRGRSCFEGFE
jgi:hypothetical protein